MNDQFIGREREIKELRAAIRNNTKGILVYGPRQVGKTRLIQEAVSSDDFLPVVHECVTGSYEYNMELLAESIANATGMEYAKSIRDFFQMLSFLETLDNQKNIVLVIDEYQYLRETKDKGVVDSYLQRFIDSIKGKITVILCGSYVSAMKELLEYGNPLFSRLQIIIPLTTFDYLDSSLFYPHLSTNEKIAFYAVFGGYPFLLKNIDENESLEENIERLLLSPYGANRAIIENVLLQEAGRTGMPIEVLSRIGNSKVRYNEIEDMMTGDVSGTLDRILKRLISMEIIEKVSPINKRNERKRTFYEIHDNLIRFYFTYIYSLRTMPFRMKPGIILEKNILPSLNTYISKRFEVQVREYFLRADPTEIEDIGSYWFDDPMTKKNGEYDCAIKYRDGRFGIFEAKYLKKPMNENLRNSEKEKMVNIQGLNVDYFGFASSSGFAFNTDNLTDIYISGDEMYRVERIV